MITLEEAIDELYHAKASDAECDEVECDRIRFFQQVEAGFRQNILDLTNMQAGMNVLARIPKLNRLVPNLKYLHFYTNLFRDNGLQKILSLLQISPKITNLDIGCNDLSDSSVMCMIEIIKQTKITSLQLGRRDESLQANRFTKEGLMTIIEAIIESDSLECFGISGIPLVKQKRTMKSRDFSKQLSKLIAKCSKLRTLDISHCGLVDSDQSILAEGFSENTSLHILNIGHNNFPSKTKIVDGICCLNHLVSLNLSGCDLSQEPCDVISRRFSEGWGIIDLNLSENPIGDNGISYLLNTLAENDTIVSLNLADTQISSELSNDFHYYLTSTTTLRDLDVSRNNFGDSVANVLADVLPNQDTIVKINLTKCRITDDGSLALGRSIALNHTLKKISLRDNFLSQQNGFELVEILQPNETIRMIDVSSNQIDCFALDAFETLCQRNKKSAHDKMLQDLRKKYIQLSIQSSKIPSLTNHLSELKVAKRDLNRIIDDLDDKIENFDLTTSANLEITGKSIQEYEQLIDQENKQIVDLQEKMREIEDERARYLHSHEIKNNIEINKFDQLIKEAEKIETETEKYKNEKEKQRKYLEENIALVEEMINEISEIMSNTKAFRKYEIPEYPFEDEFNQRPVSTRTSRKLFDEPVIMDSDSLLSDALIEASPKGKKKRGKKVVVKKPFTKKKKTKK
ncbi:hypothetical protein TRFO_02355 [Tritrichomonas foetus]|uniref:Leucine Rich Repeat family protein n=1 Tax=Tritrichomonas foetus TaxID=1144522 RepID=A0A1J4J561_9EUKA|nr:hypothetical protein TRFO_02355 [Tritrichomonas foetus]|eukprot:OHS93833.1 hypothetical protein TRFO_02355 [Tritrichomonas foetus]